MRKLSNRNRVRVDRVDGETDPGKDSSVHYLHQEIYSGPRQVFDQGDQVMNTRYRIRNNLFLFTVYVIVNAVALILADEAPWWMRLIFILATTSGFFGALENAEENSRPGEQQ